jgi:CheY-like chemotaxis protein
MKSMAMGIDVLLVEDNLGDIRLMQETLRQAHSNIRLYVAIDGEEALAFLAQLGDYRHMPRPDLILLDLNLPKKNGREVLKHIRADDGLKGIPTVILSTSDAFADIKDSYNLKADCHLSKPVQAEKLETIVRCINEFWPDTSRPLRLPRTGDSDAASVLMVDRPDSLSDEFRGNT